MAELPGTPEHYLAQYGAARSGLPGAALPWATAAREAGAARLRELGFPTTKSEQWKYTSVVPLQRIAFAPLRPERPCTVPPPPLCPGAPYRAILEGNRLRPDPGRFAGAGPNGGWPPGVTVRGFAEALDADDATVRAALERRADSAFGALNTALAQGGIVIRVAAGTRVADPIEVVYTSPVGDPPAAWHPRTVLAAEDGSTVTVVERHVGGAATGFANHSFDAAVGAGATLHQVRVQDEGATAFHINTAHVQVAAGGQFESVTLTCGGRLVRNDTVVELAGPESGCTARGASTVGDGQHVDHTLRVEHRAPRTRSRVLYKGVLDGRARGVFQGTVVVNRDAQRTDAHQLHRAVLLSEGAEVNAKPELRIHADDVRCGHGATSGRLDDEQVFYLASRGIPRETARRLLIEAFLAEAVSDVAPDGLRGGLERLLRERTGCNS